MSAKDDIVTVSTGETIYAVVHQRVSDDSEAFSGPLVIGYYPLEEGPNEVWIECEGYRVAIQPRYLREALRLLKQASEA